MQNPLPILVLCSTGKTGRRVADLLEARDLPTRRASRSGDVAFDWNDRGTWAAALTGVGAVYVVYAGDLAVDAAPGDIEAFCALAKELGVRRLVLLSGRGEEAAQRCEQIAFDSGLECTVVRASWFNQNFDEGEFAPLVQSGEVTLSADQVREPFVDIGDIAEVAVAALTEDGHNGEVYEVTGPRLMTFAEAVGEIAEASGRHIRYVPIPHQAFVTGLTEAGLPADKIALLDFLFATVLDGRNEQLSDGVQRALGRPARDFRDYARDAAAAGAWTLPEASL
ncbi:MAG: NAD(P)H-binding protein [Planctomycetota bacterium]